MLRATLLLLLLLCPRAGRGGASLGGPAQVRFLAQTFCHVLRWEPGANHTAEARYDVQYKRYGNFSWTPASHCAGTASLSCDLSNQTWSPLQQYYARVRTVIGNRTSSWTQTPSPFSPKDATLRLASVNLSVTNNRIHVTLRLPVSRWANVTFEDIHRHFLQYHVHVRRASDGHQLVHIDSSLEFDLPYPMLWGERYCVSVEPHVASRPSHGQRTEEQCISIPAAEDQTRTVVLPTFALLSLVAVGTLGMVWAWAYVKKPTKTPSVLESLLKSSPRWVPHVPPVTEMKDVVFCMEADVVQLLSLSPKNGPQPGSLSPPRARAEPPLEQSHWAPSTVWAGGEAACPGLRDVADSSGCSTDSGICLQEVSGSLGHWLDCRRLSFGIEEGGVQDGDGSCCVKMGQEFPPDLSAGKTETLALAAEGRRRPVDPPQALLSGYQKQSGSPKTLPSTDEMAQAWPGLASGYLKQPSFAGPSASGT